MKLEVGMYVRTKHGIRMIVKIDEDDTYYIDKYYINGFRQEIWCIPESCIIGEPSHNIIDLIEVGDIITYFISNKDTGLCRINNIEMLDRFKNGDKILSILTKEQFKQVSYKVGD